MAERQFGPYRLVEQIAVGGMAEIHLAKTSGVAGFEKYVALKMIHPNFSQDEQFVQMLIDEAKITVQLQHANIAQTFDLGRVGDQFYLTMEYVDGVDLFSLLRDGAENDFKMPLEVAAHVARCVANGLSYAHRKRNVNGQPLGIVHRDVSPQNVLLSRSGEVKLVDFGIAKASHRARQTEAGVIKGKYYYMSPEQALAEAVDHRSDIFSTGILLHEMITGEMLYMEDDLNLLLQRVRAAEIEPPSSVRKGVPPQLERIVMRALAKRPEDRYQSAADLATELGKFLHVHSPVFTATKVSSYIREVYGDRKRAPSPQPPSPSRTTAKAGPNGRVTKEQLLREPSEFFDENSVIFRVEDLAGAPGRRLPPASDDSSKPGGAKKQAFGRGADMSTKLLEAPALPGLGDDDEHTVISGPPEFARIEALAGRSKSATAPPPPRRPEGSARPPSRTGLPLEAPPIEASARPAASPSTPPVVAPPSPENAPSSNAPELGSPAPEAVFGHPAATPPPNASATAQVTAPTPPLRSPLVIASLVVLALAIVGAALGAIFLDEGEIESEPVEITTEP
jgi:eukaryotic-like serine/threonine-protein kinase